LLDADWACNPMVMPDPRRFRQIHLGRADQVDRPSHQEPQRRDGAVAFGLVANSSEAAGGAAWGEGANTGYRIVSFHQGASGCTGRICCGLSPSNKQTSMISGVAFRQVAMAEAACSVDPACAGFDYFHDHPGCGRGCAGLKGSMAVTEAFLTWARFLLVQLLLHFTSALIPPHRMMCSLKCLCVLCVSHAD